jgi:hypothetical protein
MILPRPIACAFRALSLDLVRQFPGFAIRSVEMYDDVGSLAGEGERCLTNDALSGARDQGGLAFQVPQHRCLMPSRNAIGKSTGDNVQASALDGVLVAYRIL